MLCDVIFLLGQQGKFGIYRSCLTKYLIEYHTTNIFTMKSPLTLPLPSLFLLPIFRYGSKLIIDQEMTGGSLLIVSSLPSCLLLWSLALISSYSHVLPPLCLFPFVHLSIPSSVHLFPPCLCPPVHAALNLSTLPFVFCPSVLLGIHLSVHPSTDPPFCPSIGPTLGLSLFPFALPSVCLSLIHPPIPPSI